METDLHAYEIIYELINDPRIKSMTLIVVSETLHGAIEKSEQWVQGDGWRLCSVVLKSGYIVLP